MRGCSLWYNPSVTLRVPPPFTQERHPRKPHIFLKYIIAEKRKKFKTYFIRLSVRINAKTGGGRKMQHTGRPNGDALTVRQLGILAAGALAAGFRVQLKRMKDGTVKAQIIKAEELKK